MILRGLQTVPGDVAMRTKRRTLGLLLIVGACAWSASCGSGRECEECSGGALYPDYDGNPGTFADDDVVDWVLDLDGDVYELRCGRTISLPRKYDSVSCEGALVHIAFDAESVKVRAIETHGRWSTEGWYETEPDLVDRCKCNQYDIPVPIVGKSNTANGE